MTTTSLTAHDLRIITALAHGHRIPHIATTLNLSTPATRSHLNRAAARLTLTGLPRPRLVDYAYRHGHLTPAEPAPLTELPPRQAQLLDALSRGMTTAQAAAQLHIGYHDAHWHRRRLYARLGARTSAHAVALGWQHQLLGPPETT